MSVGYAVEEGALLITAEHLYTGLLGDSERYRQGRARPWVRTRGDSMGGKTRNLPAFLTADLRRQRKQPTYLLATL